MLVYKTTNIKILTSNSEMSFLKTARLTRSVVPFLLRPQNRGNRSFAIPETNTNSKSVHVDVAYKLLLSGHRYLDVRTPEEFNAGHTCGAMNIPYMLRDGAGMSQNSKFLEIVSSHFRKDDKLLVGCQSGRRSLMAVTDLQSAGFTDVTDVAGGYFAWKGSGFPVM